MGLLVRASGAGIDHSVTRRVNCPEDLDGEVESMTCGHTMHSECYHTYKEVKGIPLVADLPCPLCKQTENDMARKESQLLGGTMLDGPGSPPRALRPRRLRPRALRRRMHRCRSRWSDSFTLSGQSLRYSARRAATWSA